MTALVIKRGLAGLVAAAMLLTLSSCTDDPGGPGDSSGRPAASTDGPLQFQGDDLVQQASMRIKEGKRAVFGATVIENSGSEDIKVSDAELWGDVPADGATVDEVRLIDLGEAPGKGDLLGASRWPDPEWTDWWASGVPADEATIKAGHAAELAFLVTMHQEGDWGWPETTVSYELDGKPYRAETTFGFRVCPPQPAGCDSELS